MSNPDFELIRHPYFGFGMRADEAEQLYRLLNVARNAELTKEEDEAAFRFQARLLQFLDKHPVR